MASSRRHLVLLLAMSLLEATLAYGQPSAVQVLKDMYDTCLSDFSVSCVKPKALSWMNSVVDQPFIRVTDDLQIIKRDAFQPQEPDQEKRSAKKDIFDTFEDFIQTHSVVAQVPEVLRPEGPLAALLPRSFRPEQVSIPLASTGRSKLVKRIIVPFLLGLKFKTAVLVPFALSLIALKTWKALTLGLLSLVLTGALLIFKLSKPKLTTYEVVHYPHHHEHHIEHHPPTTGWEQPGYGRQLTAQDLAYSGYTQ